MNSQNISPNEIKDDISDSDMRCSYTYLPIADPTSIGTISITGVDEYEHGKTNEESCHVGTN